MELETLMTEENIKTLQDDFYSKSFQFSYSSLNKLMWNPQAFYQMYVLGNREEKTESYLVNGKVIHCLLLEPEKFNEQFIVSPATLPTGNTRTVVDAVYRHAADLQSQGDQRTEFTDFSDAVLDILADMNLHQTLKTDQQRIDKIYTPDAMSYWEFLKSKGGKTLIDQETYDFCKTSVDLIKTDTVITSLIGTNVTEFDGKDVYNEIPLSVAINDKPFGLKGIIDNVVVDHNNKTIFVNDIKTSSKDLKDFTESVDFYNYWLQAAIYSSLIGIKFLNLIEGGYQLKFHFIVIDRNFQVYPFYVTPDTMNKWITKLGSTLDKANWHYSNKNYTLPYEFAINKVTL
jgi:hypothetical protein